MLLRNQPIRGGMLLGRDIKDDVFCRHCEAVTIHFVVHETCRNSGPNDPNHPWSCESRAVECQGCKTLSILERASSAEHYDEEWRLIPPLPKSSRLREVVDDIAGELPDELREVYHETVEALNRDLLVLAAGGIRALVDGICAARGIQGGDVPVLENDAPVLDASGKPKVKRSTNLEGKIYGLFQAGTITRANADHLHSMRTTGNAALHELEKPTKREIELALSIVEHVMAQVFRLDQLFSALTKLKERRKGARPPTNNGAQGTGAPTNGNTPGSP